MARHMTFLAGPVLRNSSPQQLFSLYKRIADEANRVGVTAVVPEFDQRLARLAEFDVDREVRARIARADSLLALIDAPGAHEGTSLSVAGEAQWAAEDGKPVAVVAADLGRIPANLVLIATIEPQALDDVDLRQLFRALVQSAEPGPAAPLASA